MNKRRFIRILFTAFLTGLLFFLYIELKTNFQQIKQQYHEATDEPINLERNASDVYQISGRLDTMHGETNTNRPWRIIERKDSYNNELQYYTKDSVVIDGDVIIITSRKEKRDNKMYTSGLVESTYTYKYGYFEFVIKVSEGKGIFPAIWLLPEDDNAFPEIDLFEMIGSKPHTFYGVIHYMKNGNKEKDYFAHEVPEKEQYKVALEWNEQSLTWYIDDMAIYSTENGVPNEFMYLIINQAVGGDWPGEPDDGTVFPNEFRVLASRIEPIHMKGRK